MRSSEEQIDPSEGFRPEFFLRCNKKILTVKLKSISFLGGYFKIVLNPPVILARAYRAAATKCTQPDKTLLTIQVSDGQKFKRSTRAVGMCSAA